MTAIQKQAELGSEIEGKLLSKKTTGCPGTWKCFPTKPSPNPLFTSLLLKKHIRVILTLGSVTLGSMLTVALLASESLMSKRH